MRSLIFFIFLVLAVQIIGALAFNIGDQTWYPGLSRPLWNPPGWVFPPVWLFLYITIAVSAWLFWEKAMPGERIIPMTFWGIQLFLNAIWSWLFFGFHSPELALYDTLAVLLFILLTMTAFWPVNRYATLLLMPYLSWVSFAGALNGWIYLNNR